MQFSCEQAATSLKLRIGQHEGTYKPWWKELQIEVYGMSAGSPRVLDTHGAHLKAIADSQQHSISFAIADDGRGSDLELTWAP
jgi:alpha-glucosidase